MSIQVSYTPTASEISMDKNYSDDIYLAVNPFGQQIRTANEIDDDIRTMARKPILGSKAADKTALGYVYIYRDPERPNLHKIGYTNKEISERQRWIQAKCSITLESIPHGLIPVRNAERAEKLVHAELRNFRRVFTCKCGTKHREWYEVTEKEALRVVRRWDSFLRQVPYDDNGRLIGLWTKRITIMPRPLSGEKPDDHDARHQRWTDVLKA
ncbi:hypothetical protein H2199_008209 [Coniosporium tulheliwenetii]|uniref:Uncharacterized protein n=1 Tax=Coniosporium tulheliwenetii TaxID=3383036 RepID=A0ACC2YKU3_9PEZI|nr:hypothetical protein H2199_008209 [Cladosporium sp. JES 115]